MELWKPLPYLGFKDFEISNTGRLRNQKRDVVYKQRVQPKTGLSFCDISITNNNEDLLRKTIYITREVAEAFVKKPNDFNKDTHVATHKKGVSKLSNLSKNIVWKTFSEISTNNMKKATPEERNRLANYNKEKFKNYKKKKYIKVADRKESNLEKELKKEQKTLEERLKLIKELLKLNNK